MRLVSVLFIFVMNSLFFVVEADEKKDTFLITEAWVREAPPNTRVMAGYMSMHNRTDGFRVLDRVSSPDFEKIEVHNMEISEGVVRMVKMKFLEIGPGKDLHLQPGGYHMMLRNPKNKLRTGDVVTLTLHFRRMDAKTIKVPVRRAIDSSRNH